MSAVTQEFRAVGDEQIARAYEKLAQKVAKLEEENQKLRSSTKLGAEEAERARQKQLRGLEEELRRTNDLKRARQELIVSTNFTRSTRVGGELIRSVDFTRPSGGGGGGGMIVRPPGGGGMIPYVQVGEGPGGQGVASWMRGGSAWGGMLSKQIVQVAELATAWFSVQKAMEAVNHQYELNLRNEQAAAQAQRMLARGQAEIVLNTFGGAGADREKLFAAAERISAQTGVPQEQVAQNLGRQAGRGVGLSLDQIIGAQEMAARLGRHTPEQIEPMATAIQQTMRIGKLSVQQAASLTQSASAAAFIGEPWQQQRFLQQTISGGLANVPKPTAKSIEEVLELGAFISQAVGEERGEAGRTSSIALLAQMQEFREGRGAWETTGPYGEKIRHPVKGAPTDPKDMIDWFHKNTRQARRFADKATFERMFEGTWRNLLLDPKSTEAALYRDTQGQVGINIPALDEQLRAIESGTQPLRTASDAAKSEAATVNFDARQTIQARRREARAIRDETLKTTDRAAWYPDFLNAQFRGIADSLGSWAEPVEQRGLRELQRRKHENENMIGPGGWNLPRTMTAERQETSHLLERMIKRLESIDTEIKQLNNPRPGAGPAMNAQRGTQSER